jgi:hypothetical protein
MNALTATDVTVRPLAKAATGLRRFHRNERGDVLPKVFLTIIALAGIVALGTIVTSAMGKLDGQTTKTMTKADQVAAT